MGKQQKTNQKNKNLEQQKKSANQQGQNKSNKIQPITKKANQINDKKSNVNGSSIKNGNQYKQSKDIKAQRKVQTDQRFTKASYDPKFLRPKKQITKVKVDNRFSKMLTDPAFQNFSKVDKYGRKMQEQNTKKQNQQLKQFYTYQDEQIEDQAEEASQQIEQNDNQIDEEQQQQQKNQKSNSIRKWMDQYDEQSSSLGEMPIDQLVQEQNEGPQVWSDDQNVVKNQNVKATKRLALCNYDWMNIASKDLMILFNSFKPATGYIKSIKVYQSILGKQKMQQQEIFGPQGIWNDEQIEDFEQEQQKNNRKGRKSWKQLLKKQDSSALDSRKLRAYEKERLKYFYAIIQCDNKKTADQIYKECDGNQFQNSNLQFDLRFIPDDIQFDQNLFKQECNQMPVSGEVKNFVNRAMGHSKVQLTWEDPELSLQANLKKKNWGKMSEQQLNKIDWSTYLNEEDIEDQQNKQELLFEKDQQQNVPEWKRECNKKYKRPSNQQELVISFDTGFNASRNAKKLESEAPSLKKQKKSKKQLRVRAQQERKKKRQDLALLTQGQDEQKEKNFRVNVDDQRFGAVYSNPLFSIDPSSQKFDHRKAGNIFKQVVQRNKNKNNN